MFETEFDPGLLTVIGFLIPLVTGIIAKAETPSSWKAWINAGIAGLASLGIAIQGGDTSAGALLGSFATVYVTNIASYYGLWRPTGTAVAVQEKTPGIAPSGSAVDSWNELRREGTTIVSQPGKKKGTEVTIEGRLGRAVKAWLAIRAARS